MNISQLLWESSPWWILACLATGLVYAGLLYAKANRLWSKPVNYLLFGLRFIVVSLLCILLLEPYLRQINRKVEKPVFAIAVDNSLSMTATSTSSKELTQAIERIKLALQEKGDVRVFSNSPADSTTFTGESSNLGELLTNIRTTYENKNLAAAVLLSDGLYNQGISPEYLPLPFPVYTLGAGDTSVRRDIILKNLYYNKVAYQGNKFRIQAEILQQGYNQTSITLQVLNKGVLLQQKQLSISETNPLLNEEILLDADKPGYQQYVFRVIGPSDEFTKENNSRSAYIEIIEGKQQVLIAAASPHPDISALRQAIERNQNYETELYIPALGLGKPKEDSYDVIVFHGLPTIANNAVIEKLMAKSSGHLFIWTSQTNVNRLNELQQVVRINQRGRETDQVFPILNTQFNQFSLPQNATEALADYPPAIVAYGENILIGQAQALLNQRIGRITTDKPLLAISTPTEKRQAVLLAEGLWRWRLSEASQEDGRTFAPVLDDLLQKTLQLLATRKQDQKFRVYPIQNESLRSEGVTFETELYNQLFEQVYGQAIKLTITDEAGAQREFSYVTSQGNSRYKVEELPAGVYSYYATTQLGSKVLSSKGNFSIIDQQLEMLNLTANHALLQNLASKTGGSFYKLANLETMLDSLAKVETKRAIITNEEYNSALNLYWLLALLLLLVSIEWFIRKYNGGY